MKGLKALSQISKQHPEGLDVCAAGTIGRFLGRHIKNLRSQVARAACLAAGDVFSSQIRGIDQVDVKRTSFPLKAPGSSISIFFIERLIYFLLVGSGRHSWTFASQNGRYESISSCGQQRSPGSDGAVSSAPQNHRYHRTAGSEVSLQIRAAIGERFLRQN